MWFLICFLNMFFILFSIMFFTLLERKILSYSQSRLGPNKISFMGILQPLLDGLKLMLNEKIVSFKYNKLLYFLGPFILFLVMIFIWSVLPYYFEFKYMNYSMLFFMVCLGISVYSSLFSGWASNSKFSMIGAIRSMAQTLSYELTMIFSIFSIFVFLNSINFMNLKFFKSIYFVLLMPMFFLWLINILSECGRAPFDFMEGESELVSGFNTEFSSSGFALLFVGEYGMIIFFSMLSSFFFYYYNLMYFFIFMFMFLSFFLLIRSAFPRFRYDFLMDLAWKKMLPFSIFFLLFIYFLSF